MEEIKGWIAAIISALALITTWVIARNVGHKKTHKDLYDRIERKADEDFVKEELKKITNHLNDRLEAHVHESQAVNELLLNAMDKQGDLIKSMDENVRIILKTMIQK